MWATSTARAPRAPQFGRTQASARSMGASPPGPTPKPGAASGACAIPKIWRLCMPTRREFLKTTIIAGTVFALFRGSEGKIWAYAQSPKLRKFVAPLPGLGPDGIPVATVGTIEAWPGADFSEMSAQQYTQKMHPDLPNPTKLWGYVDMAT